MGKTRTALVVALACTCSTLVTIGVGVSPAGATPSCANPPRDMAGWWTGDGTAGDLHGGNDGALVNGATAGAPGKVGTGFGLDGSDDRVEIPDGQTGAASLDITGAITVEAWVKPSSGPISSGAVVTQYDTHPDPDQASWGLFTNASGQLSWDVYDADGSTYRAVQTNTPALAAGMFTHVAATFDPATQDIEVYVNGAAVATTLDPASQTVDALWDSNSPVFIGSARSSLGSYDHFNGVIDEVALYARAVTGSEIAAIAGAGAAGKCKWAAEIISLDSAETQRNGWSVWPSISRDSRFVAFTADEGLVPEDTNAATDVYVRDRLLGTTERVSVHTSGAQGNSWSLMPSISRDGRYVAFYSDATNLVDNDTNGVRDVFVHDRELGTTDRVSVADGIAGAQANAASSNASASWNDAPVVSVGPDPQRNPLVVFSSDATNLVPNFAGGAGDTNGKRDYFLRDIHAHTTELVSLNSAGVQGTNNSPGPGINGVSIRAGISDNGQFVVFSSQASNLAPPGTTWEGNPDDIFVRDRVNGVTELISVSADPCNCYSTGRSSTPAISADGRYVAFSSGSITITGPNSSFGNTVHVRDRLTGTMQTASFDNDGDPVGDYSIEVALSPDGRRVAWQTQDWAGANCCRVFVRDLDAPPAIATRRMSVPVGGGTSPNHNVEPMLTAHPGFAVFAAYGDDMAPGDTNGYPDVVAHLGDDLTPPVITPVVTGTQGTNGWYTSDVNVSWTVTDPESAVTSQSDGVDQDECLPQNVTADTTAAGVTFNCYAMSAGQPTSKSVTIHRDATPPTIDHAVAPVSPDGANGWYVSAPTVTFSCGDATLPGSGLASCLADGQPGASKTLAQSASPQSVPGTATDVAGNQTVDSATGLKVDLADPTVICGATPTFQVGEAGAQVSATVTDAASGAVAPTVNASAGTSAVGTFSANVTGTDGAGRSKMVACPYAVVYQRTVRVNNVSVLEGTGGTKTVSFTVTLSAKPPSGQTASVNVVTANGSAAAGSDYVAVPLTTLTWTSTDVLTKTVSVTVNGDTLKEGNETFGLNLSAPTNAVLADGSGQATIIDEEGRFFASVKDASVTEGSSGTKNLAFTVLLSAAPAAGQSATVKVATANGTAVAPGDYTAVALTPLTFTAGQTTKTVNVTIKGDTTVESNETLKLNLSAPSANTMIADTQALGTIVKDEGSVGPTPLPTFAVTNASVVEGNSGTKTVAFTVSLAASPPAGQTASVKVATVNGTATAGSDYTKVPLTTLTWTSTDSLTKTVAVAVTGDAIKEGNETFGLNLTSPTNAGLADSSGLATIIDEEGQLFVSIIDAAVNEGNSATRAMTFTVSLATAPAPGRTAKVKFATTNVGATATAPSDYTAVPLTTLTWTSSDPLTKTVTVTIKGDTGVESHEYLFVDLSAPSTNTVIADSRGVGTIVNDD